MTITPVASKSVESISAEPNADAPGSGFDILLAGARAATGPKTDRPADPAPSSSRATTAGPGAEPAPQPVNGTTDHPAPEANAPARNDTQSDGTSPSPIDKNAGPTTDANIAGLLAVLAALGWTAPAPAATPASGAPGTDAPAPDATAAPLIDLALGAGANVTGQIPAPPSATPTSAKPATGTAPVDPAVTTTVDASIAGAVEAIASAASATGGPDPAAPAPTSSIASEAAISITGATPRPPSPNAPAATTFTAAASSTTASTAKPPTIATDAPTAPGTAAAAADAASAADAANSAAPIVLTVDHARPAAAVAHLDSTTTPTSLVGNGPTPTQAPTETAAVEQVTATPTATPPPPAEQLVHVLTPMRGSANGTYTLHIELKPAELGRVEMRVEMKDGVMHASIHSDHEGSAQLLRDALGELRDRLEAANVHTGELTVTDGGVGARDHDGTNAQPQSDLGTPVDETFGNAPTATATIAGPTTLDPDASTLLDVRV